MHRYAGWIGTVGAGHEGNSNPSLDDAATRLAAIAGTSTCHIAQSKEGILVPGVVSLISCHHNILRVDGHRVDELINAVGTLPRCHLPWNVDE